MLMKMLWKKPVGKEKLFASAYSIAASCWSIWAFFSLWNCFLYAATQLIVFLPDTV